MLKYFLSLFTILILYSQQFYYGKVVDAKSNEALVGVNLQIKGSYEGTATDVEGYYQITTSIKKPISPPSDHGPHQHYPA